MLGKKYNPKEAELRWQQQWQEEGTFRFDPAGPGPLYSIDTPPPTVSGALHIGHVFSYTQAEIIARYRRMQGWNVFYPFGFDDNGLPTERLVEKEHGKRGSQMEREEFNQLCMDTVKKYHQQFKDLWQTLGFSVDWELAYSTISPRVQKISQRSFLDLYRKSLVYRKERPALWCTECRTSIAQAELETKDKETIFNYIHFQAGEHKLQIATTRPELLGACVAVMVHPEDSRFAGLIGQEAAVPLYSRKVPILADPAVAQDKGTGAVMVCTFGDQQDLLWWQEHDLPLMGLIGHDGKIAAGDGFIGGLGLSQAREVIISLLKDAGLLDKQEPLSHTVAVHERCGRPVEYVSATQWFVSVMEHKDRLLEAGREVTWFPAHMEQRYRDWVQNLQWDWCISRQRFFGVPFPMWYCSQCGETILADEAQLPVNPLTQQPTGKCKCGSASFEPEADVMDTWATSAVTPQINAHWGDVDDVSDKMLPMSMRTQAHEIIRTWAFYTIAKSLFHTGGIPWREIMICGFVLAKKGEKISKSKDNAVDTPIGLIEEQSADVVRWWAASARLGSDIAFTNRELDAGRRLVVKLWNASRFALIHLEEYKWKPNQVSEAVDVWMLARLRQVQEQVAKNLERYEVGLAREGLERFFWHDFCDNYLEIVKDRLYNPDTRGGGANESGLSTLYQVLKELLKMFAVFVPHVTEEIFRHGLAPETDQSLHLRQWGGFETVKSGFDFPGQMLQEVLSMVRKHKSTQGLALSASIGCLTIIGPAEELSRLSQASADILATTKATDLEFEPGQPLSIRI